jgi:TRL-like protein family
MRQRLCVLLLLLFVSTGSSCVYLDVTTTLDEDLNNTTLGDKMGESSTYSVAWAVAWGDAGTYAAAKNGGITTLTHADKRYFSVLWGLYSRQTTVVYGK